MFVSKHLAKLTLALGIIGLFGTASARSLQNTDRVQENGAAEFESRWDALLATASSRQARFHFGIFKIEEGVNATISDTESTGICNRSEKYDGEPGCDDDGDAGHGSNGLRKRQSFFSCPSNYHRCSGSSWCCQDGWSCFGDGLCRRSGLRTAHIIGICIGAILILGIIVGIFRRRSQKKRMLAHSGANEGLSSAGVMVFQNIPQPSSTPAATQNQQHAMYPPPMPPAYMAPAPYSQQPVDQHGVPTTQQPGTGWTR